MAEPKKIASIPASQIGAGGWIATIKNVLSRDAVGRTWFFHNNGLGQNITNLQVYPRDSLLEDASKNGQTQDYFTASSPGVDSYSEYTNLTDISSAKVDSFGLNVSVAAAVTTGSLDVYVEEFF